MKKESFAQGVIFMLLSAIGLALTGLLGKFGLDYMNITALIFWRYLASLFLISVCMWWMGLFKESIRVHHIKMHLLRAFFVLATQYCYYFYLQKNTLLNAMVLINTGPIFIPIIEWAVLRQKVGLSTWISLAISFAGVLLVLQPDADLFVKMSWIGLLAGIMQGASQIVFGINSKEERSDLSIFYLFVFCAIFSLLPFLIVGPFATPMISLGWSNLFWLIGGLGVASILNQFFRAIAYQHGTPSRLSPFMYVSVLLAGLWDWLFFQNVPNEIAIIGASLVVLGGISKIYLRFIILKNKTPKD